MNVSVIGYYGNNFGDLLMLKSLLAMQKPGVQFTVLTYGDGESLKKQSFIRDNNIGVVDLNKTNRTQVYKNVIKSSAIIWGGGTCFMDEGGTGGIKYMALGRLFGASIIYAGIGIDNHKKLKTRLILFFAIFIAKTLYIRDSTSLQVAKLVNPWSRIGKLKQSVDLAYALDINKNDVVVDLSNSGGYIILCLRDLDGYGGQSKSEIYSQLLDLSLRICSDLGVNRVGIFNADSEVDSEVSLYAENVLRGEGVSVFKISGCDIDNSIAFIKQAKHMLSARLHPAVVAYSLGTPFSLYNYSDKNKKFASETHTAQCLIHRGAIVDFVPEYTAAFTSNKNGHRQLAQSTIYEIYRSLNLTE